MPYRVTLELPIKRAKKLRNPGLARELADADRTASESDQTGSDMDQTLAESDQASSDRDQRAAERDQRAADRDEVNEADETPKQSDAYDRSRDERAQSESEREQSTTSRSHATNLRHTNAARRDRAAQDRDAAARARDELAAALDAEIEQLALEQANATVPGLVGELEILMESAQARKKTSELRALAARQREAAARDRELAAEDRETAAADREAAEEALTLAGIDELTGALNRRAGLAAVQRELDRNLREKSPVTIAFVDLVGLKATNDVRGHAAGDKILRDVVNCIQDVFRKYDVVARVGGDEFLCAFSGQTKESAADRFNEVKRFLETAEPPTLLTVGFAERRTDETIEDLIARADAAMLGQRRDRPAGTRAQPT